MLLPTELLLSLRHVLSCMISPPLYVLSSHSSLLSVLLYLSLPPLYYLFFCTCPFLLSIICSFVPVPSSSLLSVLSFVPVPACPVLSFLLLLLSLSTSSSYCTCSRPLSISCPVLPVPDYVLILLYLSQSCPILPAPGTCLCRFLCYLQLAPSYAFLYCYNCSGPMFLSCPTCSWSLSVGPVLLCLFIPLSVSSTVIHALVSSLCTEYFTFSCVSCLCPVLFLCFWPLSCLAVPIFETRPICDLLHYTCS